MTFCWPQENCGKRSTGEIDRISNLPLEIKENILIRLPVKEAVRTCCLSSNWRLAWTSIPELVYENHSISTSGHVRPEELNECTTKMVEFVDKFLSIHDCSIRKFAIVHVKPCFGALNRWLEILSRRGIEEIQITHLPSYYSWEVPPTFWNLHCLREVELIGCIIALPQAFKGFKLLKSLSLAWLDISEADLSNLIASCPLLENLNLIVSKHGMHIRIDAPMLKHLQLRCLRFKHVCLRTPSLVKAILSLRDDLLNHRESNFIHLLDCLPKLEMLYVGGDLTKYLAYGHDPKLSTKFYHLKILHIVFNFACQRQAAVVRQLFHHAPNLQEIIVSESDMGYSFKPEEWTQNTVFEHLKYVKIRNFNNQKSVLSFVAFLLASTPFLEELHFTHEVEDPKFLQKLLQLKRASKKARIRPPIYLQKEES
ncbi:F-box/RNI/FBD-like domain protein [Rhynchospora pubera]|uniref:F-box/RNI/FBD-like domain protein n=1 Tax=Rhynchospora pubera TaxID=906938 RepID=A0AAV8BUC3_9POAL|nr:F-box/RNI/FBD-like domain protein [Rhynchospora pubera]